MGRLNFRGRLKKTAAAIKMTLGKVDYVGGRTPHAKAGNSQITGGISHMGQI